ncbi:unnamed protein product, partial [Pylaiella littoralis]
MHEGQYPAVDNDFPFGSVAATIMEEASEKNITKLGGLGNLSGMGTVDLSEKLQVAFSTHLLPPQLQEKTLRGKTWDLGNSEEDIKVDIESCAAYTSLKSEKAIELVRNTRMGELCISA